MKEKRRYSPCPWKAQMHTFEKSPLAFAKLHMSADKSRLIVRGQAIQSLYWWETEGKSTLNLVLNVLKSLLCHSNDHPYSRWLPVQGEGNRANLQSAGFLLTQNSLSCICVQCLVRAQHGSRRWGGYTKTSHCPHLTHQLSWWSKEECVLVKPCGCDSEVRQDICLCRDGVQKRPSSMGCAYRQHVDWRWAEWNAGKAAGRSLAWGASFHSAQRVCMCPRLNTAAMTGLLPPPPLRG